MCISVCTRTSSRIQVHVLLAITISITSILFWDLFSYVFNYVPAYLGCSVALNVCIHIFYACSYCGGWTLVSRKIDAALLITVVEQWNESQKSGKPWPSKCCILEFKQSLCDFIWKLMYFAAQFIRFGSDTCQRWGKRLLSKPDTYISQSVWIVWPRMHSIIAHRVQFSLATV